MKRKKTAFEHNTVVVADAVEFMRNVMPENCVDLTVTSPPYDDLRNYDGYRFDAGSMIKELHRVTKEGGVVVWVVGDKIKGGRTMTSLDHGYMARDAGFVVHDMMIYRKKNTPFMRSNAYTPCYELMWVFAKGRPKTFNPLKVPTRRNGREMAVSNKGPDAVNNKVPVELKMEKREQTSGNTQSDWMEAQATRSHFNIRPSFLKGWPPIILRLGATRETWCLIPCAAAEPPAKWRIWQAEDGSALIFHRNMLEQEPINLDHFGIRRKSSN